MANIKKSRLAQIVKEEITYRLREMLEADEEDKDNVTSSETENEPNDLGSGESSLEVAPDVGSRKDDGSADGDEPTPPEEPKDAEPPEDKIQDLGDGEDQVPGLDFGGAGDEEGEEGEEEVDVGDDEADDELSQDVEDPEDEEPEQSEVAADIEGKTIQSITMQDSEMMKGATELVIQFDESPHPLRVLIGKSGMLRFHYKGALHNEL